MADLLDLRTDGNPDTVRIDGVSYPLADFDDYSIVDQHRHRQAGVRLQGLFAQDSLSDTEAEELLALIETVFVAVAPGLPENVVARLRPGMKLQIIAAFFNARPGAAAVARPADDQPADG